MGYKVDNMAEKFKVFISNLAVDNQEAINERIKSIARAINQQYWHMKSETRNIHLLGSYGRDTAIKGVNNINLLVVLPGDVYKRFEKRGDHGQTALMLEIRESINHISRDTYFTSEGCLMIPLNNNRLDIEIIPGFLTPKKYVLYPESHQGWRWAEFNPLREMEAIDEYNFKYGGKVKHLAKMMRAWKIHYHAPIPGMLIDTLVMNFMDDWEGHSTSFSYYGFMCTDFLEYLAGLKKEQLVWYAKGSNRKISRSEDFGVQADQAFKKAKIALRHEREGDHYNANRVWKTVFGELFPM